MDSLYLPRIESRHLWSIALALSLHLFVLAIFSFAMQWPKSPEIPEVKMSDRRALEISLIAVKRNLSVNAEKKASTETRQSVTDGAVLIAEKEKIAIAQQPPPETETGKKNVISNDMNNMQEKGGIHDNDKKVSESKAGVLPIDDDTEEDQKEEDDWMKFVRAKIVANSAYLPSSFDNEVNAVIEFDVNLQPDGSVLAVEKLKASGNLKFDEAILQAVKGSQLYSTNNSIKVPSHFSFAIHMIDLMSRHSGNNLLTDD